MQGDTVGQHLHFNSGSECFYLQFSPGCCAIKAQIRAALRLSRASVVSLRAGFWSRPQFHIKTKMVMNNSPRAVSLRVTKVVGGGGGGEGGVGGAEGGLCASGKRISVHWLRVGALSRSTGVAPVEATSVIKAHVWSSHFIKGKKKKTKRMSTALLKGKWRGASTPKQFTVVSALVLNWPLSGKPQGEINTFLDLYMLRGGKKNNNTKLWSPVLVCCK